MLEAQRTTLYDYLIYQRAWNLKALDDRHLASYTAWQTTRAQATDKKGKAVCKKFTDLFDYEEELARVEGRKKSMQVSKQDKDMIMKLKQINRK